ncbi:uncharacterized protein [Branchiostoma lanceolatum]|uniref:uncharacterized protein n=1 Tax=Branchiostoma lanceolatum TaxID=7740 RepID=UPI003454F700
MESIIVPATTVIILAIAAGASYRFFRRPALRPSWPKIKLHDAYTQKVTLSLTKRRIPAGLDFGSLEDFSPVGEQKPVLDVPSFFASHGNEFSVYSIDWEQEVVVLIRTVDGTDMKKWPFFRGAQMLNATEVLLIPIEQLQAVVEAISDKVAHVQEVFVNMTARCGSTLLTRAVEASSAAQAVSEPLVLSNIARKIVQFRRSHPPPPSQHHIGHVPVSLMEEGEVVSLLRNVVSLLNYYLVTSDSAHRHIIFYKLRTDVLLIGDVMSRAFPSAKTVFLYRDGLDCCESWFRLMCKHSIVYRAYKLATRLGLWRFKYRANKNNSIYVDDPMFSAVHLQHLTLNHIMCLWICVMQHAVELQKREPGYFFHAVVYYTALARGKEKTVRMLMEKLGIEWKQENQEEDKTRIKNAFVADSQGESPGSPRGSGEKWNPRSSTWMGEWEREYFSNICIQAGTEITGPDFLLPGTMV